MGATPTQALATLREGTALTARIIFTAAMILAAVTLAFFTGPIGTNAGFVTLSYTEIAKGFWQEFEEIRQANRLDAVQFERAQRIATSWFFIGPCEGDTRKLPSGGDGAVQAVAVAQPDRSTDAAILQILAILVRGSNLGRKPSEDVCRFAEETAIPRKAR
jgi:hypothetical protein